ncbi:MAG TPA: DNA polymerase I [Haliangiales bacterium]|nr:DNA polymerase I [Haliangiales bacterium]
MPDRLVIVDASTYIYRSYFALKGARGVEMSTSTGMPTGALKVFASTLMRLYLDEKPELIAVVFDAPGPSFRHALYPAYKEGRRETPLDLVPQLPWFERIARAFHVPTLRVPGVEADDVIATLARKARVAGIATAIFGTDKDLMQLVDDKVHLVDDRDKKNVVVYDPGRVMQKFGVPPARVGEWLALRGDTSDNIPGVSGVGDVTASRLLREHGSIDGVLARLDQLKGKLQATLRDPAEQRNLALSRRLVALKDDVDVPEVTELRRGDWDTAELVEIFNALEFTEFLARLKETFVSYPDRYRTIVDEAALDELLAEARAAGELAVDTETTAPEAAYAKLVGVSLAFAGRPPAYIPVGHRYLGVPRQLEPRRVMDKLKPLLEDTGIAKHVQNLKYEQVVFARYGVTLRGVRCDPMLASYVLNPGASSHGLDALARDQLDYKTVKYEDVCGRGKEQRPFDEVDLAAATRYAAEDADVTLALGKLLRSRVEAAGMTKLLDDVEMPLAFVLGEMETIGIKVDVNVLRELSQRLGEQCQRLEREIQELAGYPVNPLSPKQLSELLYEKLALRSDTMRRTKTGTFSTDADQLEELVDDHPIIKPLLEHRELVKLKGTYLDAIPARVNPETGRLHTSYNQVAASTGRLASQNPNVQNIPVRTALGREIRRAFIAEDGFVLVSADYSQIELRVLAHLCEDPVLVAAFAGDVDVHAQTAAEVFAVPLAAVTPEMRRVAKAVNYGLGYGQSDYGLSRALDIPREDARRYIDTYFQRFRRVKEHMEAQIADARRTQVVRTLLGRRIAIPNITSGRYTERAAAERFARNAPIQGSAADILKLAMLAMRRVTDDGARMLLTVHDELVFEVREERAAELAAVAKREMERAFPLNVPLKVDVGMAKSWAEAH